MPTLILGPMLRHVTATSATIWMETDSRCTVSVLDTEAATFCVSGHHYALVIVRHLEPGSATEYEVALDGERCWPPNDSTLPPSRIRTPGPSAPVRIVFGSCRTAAPHGAPWSLELALDSRGRGVDALYTYALEMIGTPVEQWPALAVFLGDQIYADDSSPKTRVRIAEERALSPSNPDDTLPPELVGGFEEFTWLYHESWSPPIERWFFANVPTVMIFDDHEMIDDWNISAAWVTKIRRQRWWQDHVVGGLMTYWLYQHLGNLSPDTIAEEGLLAKIAEVDDGEEILCEWAMQTEEFTPVAGGYRFNFVRDIGRVRLVMIDARNGRVLEPGRRQIVDDDEWRWVLDACTVDVDHLLIASSLPVFVPGGLHDLQVWSEALCDGAWGTPGRKFGEWLRVKADLEDWPAFLLSFEAFVAMLRALGRASRTDAPATISILSGDIHFAYAAEIIFPDTAMASKVHQLVNSPIRNALTPPERTAMKLGTSRFATGLGRLLRRSVHRRRTSLQWKMDRGPVFANCLGTITFDGRQAKLLVQQTRPYDDQGVAAFETAIDADLLLGTHNVPAEQLDTALRPVSGARS